MRVLQLITRGDLGGAQRFLIDLVYGLKDSVDFEVCVGAVDQPLRRELEKLGVEVCTIRHLVREISPFKDALALSEILKKIRSGGFDLVHTHSSKAGFLGRIASRIAGVPSVHTVHGWCAIIQRSGAIRFFFRVLERTAAGLSEATVLLSGADLEIADRIGIPGRKVIIPNAVRPFRVDRGKLRKDLGIDERTKIIGNVARLIPSKDPFTFVEIARRFERKNVVFVWIGGGSMGISWGNVLHLGYREDARELMADFDVFLSTSRCEGMPISVLEALHLGIPVVARRLPQLEDLPVTLFDTVEDALESLEGQLDNPTKGANLSWSYDDFLRAYLKLYEDVSLTSAKIKPEMLSRRRGG